MGTSSFLSKIALPLFGLVSLTQAVGNSTGWTSTASTSPSSTSLAPMATGPLQNPKNIGSFTYGGCIGSPANFPTFSVVASSNLMSNDLCVSACVGHAYSATYGLDCYCADSMDQSINVSSNKTCTTACPGNGAQACGGSIPASLHHKRESVEILLSLYTSIEILPQPWCEECEEDDGDEPPPLAIYVAGEIIVTVNTFIYIDICNTCPGGLAYFPSTTTLSTTACGCATQATPTVPMTTTIKPCACGPGGAPSSVVLTLPISATTLNPSPCPTFTNGYGGGGGNGSYTVSPTGGARVIPSQVPLVGAAGQVRWAWRGTGIVMLVGLVVGF